VHPKAPISKGDDDDEDDDDGKSNFLGVWVLLRIIIGTSIP